MSMDIITVNDTSFSLRLRFYFFPLLSCSSGTLRLYHVITQSRGTKQRQWRSKSPQAAAPHPSVAAVEASHLHHLKCGSRWKDPVISRFWWRKTGVFSFQHVKSIQIPNPKSSKKAHSDFITPLQVSAVQLLIDLSSMALMTPSLASYGATSDDADWRGSSSLETMVSSLLSLIASVKFYSDSSLFSPSP